MWLFEVKCFILCFYFTFSRLPVPCPNLYVKLNALQFTLDPVSMLWVNSFSLDLYQTLQQFKAIYKLNNSVKVEEHVDFCMNGLMLKVSRCLKLYLIMEECIQGLLRMWNKALKGDDFFSNLLSRMQKATFKKKLVQFSYAELSPLFPYFYSSSDGFQNLQKATLYHILLLLHLKLCDYTWIGTAPDTKYLFLQCFTYINHTSYKWSESKHGTIKIRKIEVDIDGVWKNIFPNCERWLKMELHTWYFFNVISDRSYPSLVLV